jgi:hypothetical protein
MSFQKSLFLCVFLSSQLCSTALFASEQQAKVEYLLQQPEMMSSPQVKTLSNSLNLSEKIELYKNYKKEELVGYVFLNTLSPIAIGSFIQGDPEGAWFSTGLGVGGALLGGVGGALISAGTGDAKNAGLGNAFTIPGLVTGLVGLGLFGWGFIERIQRPQQFNQQHNQQLWEQLNLTPTEAGVEMSLRF